MLQANYLGDKQLFKAEQLMAMLLTKLKDTGEKALKTKVVDVVVSVSEHITITICVDFLIWKVIGVPGFKFYSFNVFNGYIKTVASIIVSMFIV